MDRYGQTTLFTYMKSHSDYHSEEFIYANKISKALYMDLVQHLQSEGHILRTVRVLSRDLSRSDGCPH